MEVRWLGSDCAGRGVGELAGGAVELAGGAGALAVVRVRLQGCGADGIATPYRRQRDGIATPYQPIAKPIVQGLPYCILESVEPLEARTT